MKKRDLDWSVVGLILSEFIELYLTIRGTFDRLKVGIEILPWLCGEGKEIFVAQFLHPLAQKFLDSQKYTLFRVVDEATISVNLGAVPKVPFGEATVETHLGEGWVEVQKRADGLYVSGRKVVFYLSEGQSGEQSIQGYKLRDELTGKDILNANIMVALLEHPHLIPDDWKQDESGNTRYIFFWGTIYRSASGSLCVRCLCFHEGHWQALCYWFDDDFDFNDLAAVREAA